MARRNLILANSYPLGVYVRMMYTQRNMCDVTNIITGSFIISYYIKRRIVDTTIYFDDGASAVHFIFGYLFGEKIIYRDVSSVVVYNNRIL